MNIYGISKTGKEIVHNQNNKPLDDFDGLSPNQMHRLIYSPFEGDSIIKFKQDTENGIFSDCPVFLIARDILNLLSDNHCIKLTSIGNLSPKLVQSIYDKGYLHDELIDIGVIKLRTEADWLILHDIKLLLSMAGLVRKSNNKFFSTKKASKILEESSENKLYFELLRAYCLKFSWANNDHYKSSKIGQQGFIYILYLLKKYGRSYRESTFYGKKYFRAFPRLHTNVNSLLLDQTIDKANCLEVRFFERFCKWFGLAEVHEETISLFERRSKVRKSPLFEGIIH